MQTSANDDEPFYQNADSGYENPSFEVAEDDNVYEPTYMNGTQGPIEEDESIFDNVLYQNGVGVITPKSSSK